MEQETQRAPAVLYAGLKGVNAQYRRILTAEGLMHLPQEAMEAQSYHPTEESVDGWFYIDIPDGWQPGGAAGMRDGKVDIQPPDPGLVLQCDLMEEALLRTGKIRYFAFDDGRGQVMYQIPSPHQVLAGQRTIDIQEDGEIRALPPRRGFLLQPEPDAIFFRAAQRLAFRVQLRRLYRLFPWLSQYMQELESEVVDAFLDQGLISFAGTMKKEKIGRANIRRLHAAGHALGSFTETQRQLLYAYIREMYPGLYLNEETGKFSVASDRDLKDLLYCIEQRCFYTPITGQKRIAREVLDVK